MKPKPNKPELIVLTCLFILLISFLRTHNIELIRIVAELTSITIAGYFGYINQTSNENDLD